MPGLTVTVRYQDSDNKDITLGELPGGARRIGDIFDSYWFIGEDFLRQIPQAAMSIIAEGRKNNQHDGYIRYSLKTRNEVLQLLQDNGRRGKLLVGANPETSNDNTKYWVSSQTPPTISPDLRQYRI